MPEHQALDLTSCDREPIHVPGAIQPHGVLLALSEPPLTVAQVSENVGAVLGLGVDEVLGQPLSAVLGAASADEIAAALAGGRWSAVNPLHLTARGRRLDGIVHRHLGAAILELEPADAAASSVHHPLRAALVGLQHAPTLTEELSINRRLISQPRHLGRGCGWGECADSLGAEGRAAA